MLERLFTEGFVDVFFGVVFWVGFGSLLSLLALHVQTGVRGNGRLLEGNKQQYVFQGYPSELPLGFMKDCVLLTDLVPLKAAAEI